MLGTYVGNKKSESTLTLGQTYLQIDGENILLSPNARQIELNFNVLEWSDISDFSVFKFEKTSLLNRNIKNLEVFVQNEHYHASFVTANPDRQFWQKIATSAGTDASLYIHIQTSSNQSYYTALKSKPDSPTFVSELFKSNFGNNSNYIVNTSQPKSQLSQQAGVLAYSPQDFIVPQYISNEYFRSGQDVHLDLGSRNNDSLHLLVKTESGNVFKQDFENASDFDLQSIDQHLESSTLYFCVGDPKSADRKLGVLNISNSNTLLAIQPDLLFKVTGIDIDKLNASSIAYQDETLSFVWGDIHLALTKNESGDYFAKKRIGKSKWKKAYPNTPNLLFGKSMLMDSLLFDISIATLDTGTINKVLFKDIDTSRKDRSTNINLPDSLSNLPANNEKKIVRLEGIKNEHIGPSDISLEIEIYDDSPKLKKKKYQFHWGQIDTTLVQNSKNGAYTQELNLSLAKLKSTFNKEPVLTSSKNGVVDSFECNVLHYRDNNIISSAKIKSNLKDGSIFLNAIKDVKIPEVAQSGDKIVFNKFYSPQINKGESLELVIKLVENSKGDEALSVDEQNLFLQWGDLKLKTTTLGDSSPKKRLKAQVIEKNSLERIVYKGIYLNKFGRRENIVHGEWFVNDDLYTDNSCEEKSWKDCFANLLEMSNPGDFISLFLRTSGGAGVMCQFYIDYASSDEIIGYGDTQFDSLLFKYSKYTVTKLELPKYNYEFSWGSQIVPLELVGNPKVYGGKITIQKEDLKKILLEEINLNSSDGEVISIDHAYLILYKLRSENANRRFYHYDFDCLNKDCQFSIVDEVEIAEELDNQVTSVRVFIDQHVPTEEHVKISFIDFIVEDDSNAWIPQNWISRNYPTDLFEFQFVYQDKEKTLIKFDQENDKYKWIFEKYKNDSSVELIDLPGFKTTHRAIYTKYDYGSDDRIRSTQVLSKNYTNGFRLNEYHDIASKNINLIWKGYPSLYGIESYCREDFVCAQGALELSIDQQKVKILRGDLIVLPEGGKGYKFVFEDANSEEINSLLADLPPYTSLLFENLIVESKIGKPLRLPLKFAYHLE